DRAARLAPPAALLGDMQFLALGARALALLLLAPLVARAALILGRGDGLGAPTGRVGLDRRRRGIGPRLAGRRGGGLDGLGRLGGGLVRLLGTRLGRRGADLRPGRLLRLECRGLLALPLGLGLGFPPRLLGHAGLFLGELALALFL